MDDFPPEELQPRLLRLTRRKGRKVVLWLSQTHFPQLCCLSRRFPPKNYFPHYNAPQDYAVYSVHEIFHVSPDKHLLSVEHVNDHPRWSASLPLKAACDGSK